MFYHRARIDYTKSMEEALKLSQKINEALSKHDKKVRPNAGGKNNTHALILDDYLVFTELWKHSK